VLLCSPTFLFLLPGALMVLAGLAAIPIVVLAGYGVWTNIFGPNFMYTASLVSIAGAHLLAFGCLAKLHAHLVDPVFRDPRVERLVRFFTVERGLVWGSYLILASLILAIPVFVHWCRTFAVPVPGQWIFAGTLFMLGIESIFVSFLVGILDLKRESNRCG
jgi:hypothetical protein